LPNGRDAILMLILHFAPEFRYEPGMIVADRDLVMIHGRYTGWGPKPMVAVDIFRVIGGKLAEHWDVLQEEVPASATATAIQCFLDPDPRNSGTAHDRAWATRFEPLPSLRDFYRFFPR
jgi:hypothetical protein